MGYDLATIGFENPERPAPAGQHPSAELSPISTDYFGTMGVPLLQGRDFTDADTLKLPQVMIVNQAFVQQYFPGAEL
jgi:hypothetical protein